MCAHLYFTFSYREDHLFGHTHLIASLSKMLEVEIKELTLITGKYYNKYVCPSVL